MRSTKIRDVKELRIERELLEFQLAEKEVQLAESWDYLRQHYKSILWSEINPLKNNRAVKVALGLVQPVLLPVLSELLKGTTKGKAFSRTEIWRTAKFALASLGVKWLSDWLDSRETSSAPTGEREENNQESPES
jgi:hypothetical protein